MAFFVVFAVSKFLLRPKYSSINHQLIYFLDKRVSTYIIIFEALRVPSKLIASNLSAQLQFLR